MGKFEFYIKNNNLVKTETITISENSLECFDELKTPKEVIEHLQICNTIFPKEAWHQILQMIAEKRKWYFGPWCSPNISSPRVICSHLDKQIITFKVDYYCNIAGLGSIYENVEV